jgi:hypothetical protein
MFCLCTCDNKISKIITQDNINVDTVSWAIAPRICGLHYRRFVDP